MHEIAASASQKSDINIPHHQPGNNTTNNKKNSTPKPALKNTGKFACIVAGAFAYEEFFVDPLAGLCQLYDLLEDGGVLAIDEVTFHGVNGECEFTGDGIIDFSCEFLIIFD